MSLTGNNGLLGSSAHETNQPKYKIRQSLRLDDDSNAGLSRTPSSASNRKTWTFSCWIKQGHISQIEYIFNANTYNAFVGLGTSGQIQILSGNGSTFDIQSTRLFRDPGAWYHLVYVWDTTQATNTDRIKCYANGEAVTLHINGGGWPSQNADLEFNNTVLHSIGGTTYNYDGLIAEVHFVDGQALTPASFGETNSDTNQWQAIKYAGSYGTNGFYLDFSDSSSLGTDSSGNGNNYTPANLAATDQLPDSPTNNFATLNPLDQGWSESSNAGVNSEGNLKTSNTAGGWWVPRASIGQNSGKWYFEVLALASNIYMQCGIEDPENNAETSGNSYRYRSNGNKYASSGAASYGATWSSSGDIIGVAMNLDDNEVTFYKNNSSQGAISITSGVTYQPVVTVANSGIVCANFGQDSSFAGNKTAQNNSDGNGKGDFYYTPPTGFLALCTDNLPDATITTPSEHFNTITYTGNGTSPQARTGLGHKPSFLWIKDRGATNNHVLTDAIRGPNGAGGLGQAGLLYSNANTAEVTGGSQVKSYDTDGFTTHSTTYVNVNTNTYVAWSWKGSDTPSKTYTVTVTNPGSGNRYTLDGRVSGTNAMPITLEEGGTYTFDQSDSSNGGHPLRFSTTSNGTHGGGSEYTTGVTTNGVPGQAGAYTRITVAASAPTLYYYCTAHSGMGAEITTPGSSGGVSNLDGTIASVVNANTTAGFSIVAYTGITSSGTVGHGLSQAPELVIVKPRTYVDNWRVGSDELTSWVYHMRLNDTAAETSYAAIWNSTAPTSTVFSSGTDGTGGRVDDYISYCFHSVDGYSKVGSYEGNGSADGSFIYLGFKPEFFLIKNVDAVEAWEVWDGTRETHNKLSKKISPNTSDAEYTANTTTYAIDFLSNGVKLRTSYSAVNGSNTFLYYAVASSPFKTANAR